MPRLSIVIPTLGNWEALETSLVSVLQNQPPRSEVVVVHNGRYEDPYDLKNEVRFVEAPARSRLVGLINTGLAASRAEVIHLLPSGAVVEDGWTAGATRHFADLRVSVVTPVVLDVHRPTRLLSAGCYWLAAGKEIGHASGRTLGELGTGDPWTGPDRPAAFFRRSAVVEVGSFDETLSPGFAAIDLSLRLIRAGGQIRLEPTSQVMIESTLLERDGAFRRAWQRERLFWRHRGKEGWLGSMAAHAWLVATETLKSVPRPSAIAGLAGRLVGVCDPRGPSVPAIEHLPGGTASAPGSVDRRVDPGHVTPASQSRVGAGASRAAHSRGR
ncbi:MAG TPA: glycosyltransferase [Pirellulales bacterium]|nr:glycosyltransferase [Pirellulales bacterium]